MTAHQRLIRDAMPPLPVAESLHGYTVETISKADATPVIMHYEWLGNVGRATTFVGLLSPERELHGVACFGNGPTGDIRQLIGKPALCLERGACVHYAPKNSASFLINRACKLVYRITGTALFFAYGDPSAGEYGGVYQAAGWAYLGQGLNGKTGRSHRIMVLPPGADPNDPANWKTTRVLRRGVRMSMPEARAKGWQLALRPAKHVYATNVGKDRKRWLANLDCPPYPAPRPDLKIKPPSLLDEGPSRAAPRVSFSVSAPPVSQLDMFGDDGRQDTSRLSVLRRTLRLAGDAPT